MCKKCIEACPDYSEKECIYKDKKAPHVHAELIKAWANGAKIQMLGEASGTWYDCTPSWYTNIQYRIKPEPKPDIIRYGKASFLFYSHTPNDVNMNRKMTTTWWTIPRGIEDNIKVVFDGETGKLKSVEMIK